MARHDDYERIEVRSRSQLRTWLAKNQGRSDGVWIVTHKKGRGPHVPWAEVVEELLCVGWIDSKPRKLDEDRTMLLAAPRKPASAWSKLNKERVATLTKAGRMRPSGLAVVEAAKRSGRWSALDAVEALEIPPDLATALDAAPPAAAHFSAFPRSAKRGILEWILAAKRPETRAQRIEETARRARKNQRANQWPRPK